MNEGIFISYRREDSRHVAGRLRDLLATSLSPDRLFMDVDNISLGHDFHEVLNDISTVNGGAKSGHGAAQKSAIMGVTCASAAALSM